MSDQVGAGVDQVHVGEVPAADVDLVDGLPRAGASLALLAAGSLERSWTCPRRVSASVGSGRARP
ncbi:hypothetical protein ACLQ2P_11055 [Actinomadura citrea]|uniref:hypothetical protein n=1 Tax=Actinomadura citrea TaxID=46158 RepID=UPI003CE4BA7E